MKHKALKSPGILLIALFLIHSSSVSAQYTIRDVFADLSECDTMTQGIFLVWWDKDTDLEDKVAVLLDTMNSYRTICLEDMGMADPPNPEDGHYYNVYMHGNGYFSQYNWGNGQGTDVNGYPFLTLPAGLVNDWPNTAHETFHVFQYNANAPGFAYSGDSQWYIEASANWFAARQNPESPRRFVEAESLVRMPHVPFWLSYDNFPDDYPSNWQRYVHQYALALHLYYLTDVVGVSEDIITEGMFSGTEELPQEYMSRDIGAEAFRQHFVDWAAHMTNDFDFIPAYQAAVNLQEWNTYADPDDDNEFIDVYEDEGTAGWVSPAPDEVTNAWSFNTWKLRNSEAITYTFELAGSAMGSYGDEAHFRGKVLVQNSESGASFHDLEMSSHTGGSLELELSPADTTVYFIIASVPDVFEDANPTFQRFPYEIRIQRSETTAVQDPDPTGTNREVVRYNLAGQPVSPDAGGYQFILYEDGSVRKILRILGVDN